jgi:hypothetical protein
MRQPALAAALQRFDINDGSEWHVVTDDRQFILRTHVEDTLADCRDLFLLNVKNAMPVRSVHRFASASLVRSWRVR